MYSNNQVILAIIKTHNHWNSSNITFNLNFLYFFYLIFRSYMNDNIKFMPITIELNIFEFHWSKVTLWKYINYLILFKLTRNVNISIFQLSLSQILITIYSNCQSLALDISKWYEITYSRSISSSNYHNKTDLISLQQKIENFLS